MTRKQLQQWQVMLSRSFDPADWWAHDDETAGPVLAPGRSQAQAPERGRREAKIMWVYRQVSGGDRWAVGYWSPERVWHQDSEHASRDEAADRVHWLNGGD